MEPDILHRAWIVSNTIMLDRAMAFLTGHAGYEDLTLDDEQERVLRSIFEEFKAGLPDKVPRPTPVEVGAFGESDLRRSMELFSNMTMFDAAVEFYKAHDEFEDMGLVDDQHEGILTMFKEFKNALCMPSAPVPAPAPAPPPASVPATPRPDEKKVRHYNGWTLFQKEEMLRLKAESVGRGKRPDRPAVLMKQAGDAWRAMNAIEKAGWSKLAQQSNAEADAAAKAAL